MSKTIGIPEGFGRGGGVGSAAVPWRASVSAYQACGPCLSFSLMAASDGRRMATLGEPLVTGNVKLPDYGRSKFPHLERMGEVLAPL